LAIPKGKRVRHRMHVVVPRRDGGNFVLIGHAKCNLEMEDIFFKVPPEVVGVRTKYKTYRAVVKARVALGNQLEQLKESVGLDTELENTFKQLKTVEKLREKELFELLHTVDDLHIVKWLRTQNGVGEKTIAAILAYLYPLSKWRGPRSLWRFLGLHVTDGRAPKLTRGKTSGYSMAAKKAVVSGLWVPIMTHVGRFKADWAKYHDTYYNRTACNSSVCKKTGKHSLKHKQLQTFRAVAKNFILELWVAGNQT
jgi:hypothetical protein